MAVSQEEFLYRCTNRHRDWLTLGVYVDSLEECGDENVLGWRLLIQEEQWPFFHAPPSRYCWRFFSSSIHTRYEPLRMEATLPSALRPFADPPSVWGNEASYPSLLDALTDGARAFTLAARRGWTCALTRPQARVMTWEEINQRLGPWDAGPSPLQGSV